MVETGERVNTVSNAWDIIDQFAVILGVGGNQ